MDHSRGNCSLHAKLIKGVYIFIFLDPETTSNNQNFKEIVIS